MNSLMCYLIDRMKEPSTWAGVATILVAFKLTPNDPGLLSAITTIGVFVGGALAAAFPEGK